MTKPDGVVTRQCLWEMVEIDWWSYLTYKRQQDHMALADAIEKETGRSDALIEGYAEILIYLYGIRFSWRGDVPDYIRSLETWWNMLQQGKSQGECYAYFIEHVANQVYNDLREEMGQAIRIWKPAEERMDDNLTDEERTDPKGKRPAKRS